MNAPSMSRISTAIHLGLLAGILSASVPAGAVTFTVNSTADVVDAIPGVGQCRDDLSTLCTTDADCTNAGPGGPCDRCATGSAAPSAPGTPECTLRAAIQEANATPGADTIDVPAGNYALTISGGGEDGGANGDLDITEDLTLVGAGAATTIIEGMAGDRVFHVHPNGALGTTSISGVTVQNGSTGPIAFVDAAGGGILLGSTGTAGDPVIPSGTLTLTDCVIQGNFSAGGGGGIANKSSTLVLVRSRVSNNTNVSAGGYGGGGIDIRHSTSQTTLIDSTVSNNSTASNGGGIEIYGGQVTVLNSTISGNTANNSTGGGIARVYGTLTMANSTVSGNTAADGAGIYIWHNDFSLNTLNNATIASNHALGNTTGGGINNTGSLTLKNTIIAGNTRAFGDALIGADCGGNQPLISQGYNLIQNSCSLTGDLTGNITGQDARLGPLANNGGLTQTHALIPGGPAIDAGNPAPPTAGDTGGNACAATDQRGESRPQDGNGDGVSRCDIGAYETTPGTTADGIAPGHAGNVGPVCASVFGSGFVDGAMVKFTRDGEQDIPGDPVTVLPGGHVISTAFNLKDKTPGAWNVVVMHPDGTSQTLAGAFTIDEGGAPVLWHDVVGPSVLRGGWPTRFFFFYGNRGNVDAVGVPILIAVPSGAALEVRANIVMPPVAPGQAPVDLSNVPIEILPGDTPDETIVPLLVPIIPAGSAGVLEFVVTAPTSLPDPFVQIYPGVGAPWFTPDGDDADYNPDLDPEVSSALANGAKDYALRVFGIEEPPFDLAFATEYARTQLEAMVATGAAAWLESGGGSTNDGVSPPHYCLTCLPPEIAVRGSTQDGVPPPEIPPTGGGTFGWELALGSSGPGGPGPWQCRLESDRFNRLCSCPPDSRPVVQSHDPNDKVGSRQAGGPYVSGDEPLRYAIYFENIETATAPAQEVVIEDQLDVANLDLASFSFGPISFGDRLVVPVPGVSEFTQDVDLNPELLVRIDARLDRTTGLITWRFTSLDPATGQLPGDPLAGFLPPNVNPPEGDGAVAFTVRYKDGWPTGAEVCNRANIFFDQNDPIVTPVWCNLLDSTKPVSQVLPLAATQYSPDFLVQWAGTDAGVGIQSYTLFASDNGGPFLPLLSRTQQTSVMFAGQTGNTYAFYTVAWDQALNEESPPTAPDATTIVEVCTASAPTGVPILEVAQVAPEVARLSWTRVATATGYDVVRGSLSVLLASGGDFGSATEACLVSDLAATAYDASAVPAASDDFWYLVRPANCGGPGSYDGEGVSQVGLRDAEIGVSAGACP